LTKPLSRAKHDQHQDSMGVRIITMSSRLLILVQVGVCRRYALEAIMYDDISYVFINKDSPWTLSMMCISKYVTCLWDYALYDDCPKKFLVERAVWTRNRLD